MCVCVCVHVCMCVCVAYSALLPAVGPRIGTPDQQVEGYSGQAVLLSCDVEGEPVPTVRWLFLGEVRALLSTFSGCEPL